MQSGLWAYTRHPNYFGSIFFGSYFFIISTLLIQTYKIYFLSLPKNKQIIKKKTAVFRLSFLYVYSTYTCLSTIAVNFSFCTPPTT
jgi:isoprenylcysteine carboxyl methyltransferase (ICMT) family protein YpbQ